MKYAGTLIAVTDRTAVVVHFAAHGLTPAETAVRMDFPLDFIVSSLRRSK